MKIIYVAGPYRGQREWDITQNIRKAEAAAIGLWKKGWAVICPHKNTAYFGGICPDQTWLDGDLLILAGCDAIFMLDNWETSYGASIEYSKAVELGMPIFYEKDGYPESPGAE